MLDRRMARKAFAPEYRLLTDMQNLEVTLHTLCSNPGLACAGVRAGRPADLVCVGAVGQPAAEWLGAQRGGGALPVPGAPRVAHTKVKTVALLFHLAQIPLPACAALNNMK